MSIKAENYITIPGWVVSNLNLKGNDLIIYCAIYGFTQIEGQWFKGSTNYLAEWVNSTHQGVMKNLDNLVEMGLIIREDHTPTNWYCANLEIIKELRCKKDTIVNSVEEDCNLVTKPVNSVNNSSKLSLLNNINNNTNKNNKYKENLELSNTVEEIISYFNNKCNTKFRTNTVETRRLVKARLKEGFTVDDFKKVIDCKYEDWGKKPIKFKTGQWSNEYLRPSTLFSDKFESYVYEASVRESSEGFTPFNSVSVKADDEDRADFKF